MTLKPHSLILLLRAIPCLHFWQNAGGPGYVKKSLTLSGFQTYSGPPEGARPLQNGGSPRLCLPSNWNGLFRSISKARMLLLGMCARAFEIWPTLSGVCRRIQESEPIEIGEALGVEWFRIAPVLLTARANR